MSWYKKSFISKKSQEAELTVDGMYSDSFFFTPEFRSIRNDLAIRMANNLGKLDKIVRFGKLRDAINSVFHRFLPDEILGREIVFASSVNGSYLPEAACGTDNSTGNRIIVLNPEHVTSRSVLHEIKHELDILKGKQWSSHEDFSSQYNNPEERRSRRFEESFIKKVHRNLIDNGK